MNLKSLPIGMFAILWLIGWTLRVPILAAPPLATRIADSFALGEVGIGALTMLPIVAVAFGAIPAAWVIAKLGVRVSIVAGICVMALASTTRAYVPTTELLFSVSIIMGLGVALFQTALPVAARTWTPSHAALGSAVYLNGMMVGEFSGAGLTIPLILPLSSGDWRMALVIWSIPILLIAAIAYSVNGEKSESKADKALNNQVQTGSSLPSWNDRNLWQFGLLLASSIVIFYSINAYIGSVLQAKGEEQALAGLLFAFNLAPLIASFVVLAAPHWIGKRDPLGIAMLAGIAGLTGFVFLNGWVSWLSAVLAAFSSTVSLILLVSIPVVIAKGHEVTRLSAGITLIGYGIAFVLPIIGGWLAQLTGQTSFALLPALVFSILILPALGRAPVYTKPRMIS